MLSYWLRVRKLPVSRLAKVAYNAQREMQAQGIACWGKEIYGLLQMLGEENYWITDVVNNGPLLRRRIEMAMRSIAMNNFQIACLGKPSLNVYNQHNKAACKVENLPRKYIRVILSSRYQLPTFVERVTQDGTGLWRCKLCKEFVMDKWLHMFKDCNEANQIRNRVIVSDENPHQETLFPSSIDSNIKVAKYIFQFEKLVKEKENKSQKKS